MKVKITEHFHLEEFACHDGTKYPSEWVYSRLMPLCGELEIIRAALNDRPMIVVSGFRTPTHNEKIGGVQSSQHLLGKAADIVVEGLKPSAVHSVISQLYKDKKITIGGLGLYQGWVHVDIRQGNHLAMWFDIGTEAKTG